MARDLWFSSDGALTGCFWNNWIWVCKLGLSRADGCQFGFGGGSKPLALFRRCPDWLLPILNNWIWVCKLDLSRPDGCQFGFGGGSRPLVFFRRCLNWMLPILKNWIWICKLDLSKPDGCQFEFGGGSRPFVSLDGALPILNNHLVWAWKLVIPDLKARPGCPKASWPLDGRGLRRVLSYFTPRSAGSP